MATKKERQRQLAREAYARRQVRQAQRARRTRKLWATGIAVVLVLGAATGVAAAAGAFTPAKVVTCVYTKSGKAARKVSLPPTKAYPGTGYTATITTNRGTVDIDLLNSAAACTVNSFVSLADQGFYNNTPCPRLTTASTGYYILQCGDPTGTGSGGPGYKFKSENLTGAKYPADTVAMANSGTPDSNGSQFFLVYKSSPFPPDYTPFGTITSGLNVLTAIAAKGDNNSNPAGGGKPNEKVQIERVTISKT